MAGESAHERSAPRAPIDERLGGAGRRFGGRRGQPRRHEVLSLGSITV
jgi:hypothetical protein